VVGEALGCGGWTGEAGEDGALRAKPGSSLQIGPITDTLQRI
jgi:hypothetical protein